MTLRYIGGGFARRYFIERNDGRVWAGQDWSENRTDAIVWADLQAAHLEYNRLQLEAYHGKPVREFECRLVIRVHGDQAFALAELREYLLRACRLTMDVEAQGDGPVDGTFVVPVAMFESLRPVDIF